MSDNADKTLTVEQYREKIRTGEMRDPLVFLESIMCGQNPNSYSELYDIVLRCDNEKRQPTPGEWMALVDIVKECYMYSPVSQASSINAAKTLTEYIHPKRKSIDLRSNSNVNLHSNTPLTAKEIYDLKDRFNDQF